VTLRAVSGLYSFRSQTIFRRLRDALSRASRRLFAIVHFSVQSNHVHLIVEAHDKRALSRGMQGLGVRLARAHNRLAQRRGSVFADRYHAHELATPRAVRNALVYVLQNHRKHVLGARGMDAMSSAAWFDGWSSDAKAGFDVWARAQPGVIEPWVATGPPVPAHLLAREADKVPPCPVVPSGTWLGTVGWRVKSGRGAIKLGECPAGADWMRTMARATRN
jgi:REP element-mobilizing transposase RayT